MIKLPKPTALFERIRALWSRDPDRFLHRVSGVIHVGASTGQERGTYDALGLRVLWIEPLPEVFAALQTNLASFPRQRALQALVTDRDHQTYPFHVANNEGASSSILEFKDHQDIWPEVQFTGTLSLEGTTLVSLLRKHDIDPADYDALVMDTQGTELRVLQGAVPLLRSFLFIQTEVADFEAYAGCCQLHDLEHFLKKHGFREISRRVFARHPRQGAYYDVTYQRVDSE